MHYQMLPPNDRKGCVLWTRKSNKHLLPVNTPTSQIISMLAWCPFLWSPYKKSTQPWLFYMCPYYLNIRAAILLFPLPVLDSLSKINYWVTFVEIEDLFKVFVFGHEILTYNVTCSGKRWYKSRYALTHNRPFHVKKVKNYCHFYFLSCTASLISIFSDFINRNVDFDK